MHPPVAETVSVGLAVASACERASHDCHLSAVHILTAGSAKEPLAGRRTSRWRQRPEPLHVCGCGCFHNLLTEGKKINTFVEVSFKRLEKIANVRNAVGIRIDSVNVTKKRVS